MQVEALMTKSVRTCRPDDKLDVAAQLMWDHDCGCVPVLDHTDQVVGMITDRDICMSAWTQGKRLSEVSVSAAMSWRVVSVRPDDALDTAEEMMRTNQVRRLPVLDRSNKLVGLLSLADIAREARREMLLREREVEGIEVAATLAAVSTPVVELQVSFDPSRDAVTPVLPRPREPKTPEPKSSGRVKVQLD